MNARYQRHKREAHEGERAIDAKVWQVEAVPHGQHDGEHAKHTNADDVGQLGVELTVEAIVQPGNDGAHYQDCDASIVQSVEKKDTHSLAQGHHLVLRRRSHLEKIWLMTSEWQDTVWKRVEHARQRMAPMKKHRKMSFSDSSMSMRQVVQSGRT